MQAQLLQSVGRQSGVIISSLINNMACVLGFQAYGEPPLNTSECLRLRNHLNTTKVPAFAVTIAHA